MIKNMLVTGSAGFIGSNFVRYELEKYSDLHIISIDKLTYAGNLDNLSGIDSTRHTFIQGDIVDEQLISDIFKKYKIDTVVHFAAESHVDRSITHPRTFIETNVLGTFDLLQCAKQFASQLYRFHHISTDEVYGSLNKNDVAFTEQHPYQPNSPYSASKAGSDHFVRAFAHTYDLPITISNCSNNYGPYQHREKFIPLIIDACIKQKNIPIYGDGSNIRDWIYVVDHCDAIDKIIRYGKCGETYNVGGECEISNLELAQCITKLMDDSFPTNAPHEKFMQFVTDRLGHDWRYAIDNAKIKRELHWQPKTKLMDGLKKTIGFYTHHGRC